MELDDGSIHFHLSKNLCRRNSALVSKDSFRPFRKVQPLKFLRSDVTVEIDQRPSFGTMPPSILKPSFPLSSEYPGSEVSALSIDTECAIIEKVLTSSNLEKLDLEPLRCLVYQHYFRSPCLFSKMIEKSRNLFRSGHGSDVDYMNDESRLSFSGEF